MMLQEPLLVLGLALAMGCYASTPETAGVFS